MHKNHNPSTAGAQRAPTFLDAKNAIALPDGKPNILRFGEGLDLWVQPSGRKTWRCKVQRGGKQTTLTLGYFPAMKINEAKAKRIEIRLAADPVREKRVERAKASVADASTFRLVAERWAKFLANKARWTDLHRIAVDQRLANHVFPGIGDRPIGEVTATDVGDLITALHQRKPALAITVKQYVERILDFAVANDLIAFNPAKKIASYLPTRVRGDETPRTYVRTIEDARLVLAAIERRATEISPWTLLVHRMIALTGVRKNEALGAKWSEFDLHAAVWTVPAERMKGKAGKRRAHTVALSPQAIEVVQAANRIRKNEFVFPALLRGGRQDDSGLNRIMTYSLLLARLGRIHVPHGWRSTFSTIMNEVTNGAEFRVIDVMLAHASFRDSVEDRDTRKSSVESRYNHADYQSSRHRIACQWADLLLDGAPTALALIGLDEKATNVVQLVPQARRVAG